MGSSDGGGVIAAVLILVLGFVAYFLPSLIANSRGRDGQGLIFVLNLVLGWTVIGWCILLIVSFTGESGDVRNQRAEQLALMRKMADAKQE